MQPKKRQTGFVPPPPPVVPNMLAQGLIAPQGYQSMMPQIDSPTPAPAPMQAPATTPLQPMGMPPGFADALLGSMNGDADILKSARDDYNNFQGMALPEAPERSPFENMVGEAMKQKMTDLITGKESPGQRFGRGYDAGQKIAGNILVPLMGMLSKDAGTAIGTAQATQQLKQQSMEADRQRAAERHANNSSLLQMAELWQNLDKDSAKNLLSLASQRLKVTKENSDARNDKFGRLLTAEHNHNSLANQLVQTLLKAQDQTFDQTAGSNKDAREGFELNNKIRHQGVQESNDAVEMGLKKKADVRADKQLDLTKDSRDLAAKKFAAGQEQDKTANTFKAAGQMFDNQKYLSGALRQILTDSQAKNALGQPRFGSDYLDRILSNPGHLGVLDELAKKAGVKTTATEMLKGMQTKQSIVNHPSWSDGLLQTGMSLAGSQLGSMLGVNSGPRDVMPTKENSDPMQGAFQSYVAKHGKKPTPEELLKELNGG